jgi:hypothetical protein
LRVTRLENGAEGKVAAEVVDVDGVAFGGSEDDIAAVDEPEASE